MARGLRPLAVTAGELIFNFREGATYKRANMAQKGRVELEPLRAKRSGELENGTLNLKIGMMNLERKIQDAPNCLRPLERHHDVSIQVHCVGPCCCGQN